MNLLVPPISQRKNHAEISAGWTLVHEQQQGPGLLDSNGIRALQHTAAARSVDHANVMLPRQYK